MLRGLAENGGDVGVLVEEKDIENGRFDAGQFLLGESEEFLGKMIEENGGSRGVQDSEPSHVEIHAGRRSQKLEDFRQGRDVPEQPERVNGHADMEFGLLREVIGGAARSNRASGLRDIGEKLGVARSRNERVLEPVKNIRRLPVGGCIVGPDLEQNHVFLAPEI